MLGEEDVKKQQLNKELPGKDETPKVESADVSNAFTLDGTRLRGLVKELAPEAQDHERYSHEISEIVDFVKNTTGAKEWNDILWEVRLLSKQIGNDVMGQSQLQRLFRYVYLQNERTKIDRELKKESYVRV